MRLGLLVYTVRPFFPLICLRRVKAGNHLVFFFLAQPHLMRHFGYSLCGVIIISCELIIFCWRVMFRHIFIIVCEIVMNCEVNQVMGFTGSLFKLLCLLTIWARICFYFLWNCYIYS